MTSYRPTRAGGPGGSGGATPKVSTSLPYLSSNAPRSTSANVSRLLRGPAKPTFAVAVGKAPRPPRLGSTIRRRGHAPLRGVVGDAARSRRDVGGRPARRQAPGALEA